MMKNRSECNCPCHGGEGSEIIHTVACCDGGTIGDFDAFAGIDKKDINNIEINKKDEDMDNFNELTAAETERLALLAEECGEVIQIIGKVLRHGYESCNPFDAVPLTNRDKLEKEIGDVKLIIHMMINSQDLRTTCIGDYQAAKATKIIEWLHHQG